MLITTHKTIALRCPICGKMDFSSISRFNLSGDSKISIDCECGANLLVMGRLKNNRYWMQIECSMCESRHLFNFSKDIWSKDLFTFICEETGVEIGFLGSRDIVLKNVQNMDKTIEEITEELGYGDYFINPEIMYKVLEYLHDIADKGKLICNCGNNNLDVEVHPDRIEFHCTYCSASGIVFAETSKDWELVKKLKEIILTKGTNKYIDDNEIKRKRRIKK